ncbi:MAG: PAS domain S-box protein [Firmicutes bacterium]|nr:PAS domain S-box protein [Bacillota bacterium]
MLLENLPVAYAYHQIVLDEQKKPVDYIFLNVNPAFEKMTGLKKKNIIGKKVTEIMPGFEYSSFNLLDAYGSVALNGGTKKFEHYFASLGRYFEIFVYGKKKKHFSVIFHDITDKKEKEERSKELNSLYNFSLLLNKEKNDLEKIIEETIKFLPSSFRYPENACACIALKDRQYKTKKCQPTFCSISFPLELHDKQIGMIKVCYLKQPPFQEKDYFLNEEKLVLKALARHINHISNEIKLKKRYRKVKKTFL